MNQSLRTVEQESEIRKSVLSFSSGITDNLELATSLFRQTTYWVYDPQSKAFGPGKFVGFAEMDFETYQVARAGETTGTAFDGGVTHQAIERVLNCAFDSSVSLTEMLSQFAKSRLHRGVLGVLDGINVDKWRFAVLPSSSLVVCMDVLHKTGKWVWKRMASCSNPESNRVTHRLAHIESGRLPQACERKEANSDSVPKGSLIKKENKKPPKTKNGKRKIECSRCGNYFNHSALRSHKNKCKAFWKRRPNS